VIERNGEFFRDVQRWGGGREPVGQKGISKITQELDQFLEKWGVTGTELSSEGWNTTIKMSRYPLVHASAKRKNPSIIGGKNEVNQG